MKRRHIDAGELNLPDLPDYWNIDRINQVVAARIMKALEDPSIGAGKDSVLCQVFRRCLDNGWCYTDVLGIFVDILAKGLTDSQYVPIHCNRVVHGNDASNAHLALATVLFGSRAGQTDDCTDSHRYDGHFRARTRDIDPRGVLFDRVGNVLYSRQRLGGEPVVWVHPRLNDYMQGILSGPGRWQVGGSSGGEDDMTGPLAMARVVYDDGVLGPDVKDRSGDGSGMPAAGRDMGLVANDRLGDVYDQVKRRPVEVYDRPAEAYGPVPYYQQLAQRQYLENVKNPINAQKDLQQRDLQRDLQKDFQKLPRDLPKDLARDLPREVWRGEGAADDADTCEVAKGRDGTFIRHLKAECLPPFKTYCVWQYEILGKPKECTQSPEHLMNIFSVQHNTSTGGLLVKKNASESETIEELAANSKVYEWMRAVHQLHLTPLHERISHITAVDPSRGSMHLPVMHAMDGDLSILNLARNNPHGLELTPLYLADVGWTVLTVLRQVHGGNHLHQDIKPINILYRRRKREFRVANPPAPGQHDIRMSFVVADYGILEHVNKIHGHMLEHKYSGTPGYISPLLLRDCTDESNNVYHHFLSLRIEHTIQLASPNENQYTNDDIKQAYIREMKRLEEEPEETRRLKAKLQMLFKDEQNALMKRHDSVSTQNTPFAKIDLHSLGITLFKLLRKSNNEVHSRADPFNYNRLITFLYKLMFFGQGSYSSADEALKDPLMQLAAERAYS